MLIERIIDLKGARVGERDIGRQREVRERERAREIEIERIILELSHLFASLHILLMTI